MSQVKDHVRVYALCRCSAICYGGVCLGAPDLELLLPLLLMVVLDDPVEIKITNNPRP